MNFRNFIFIISFTLFANNVSANVKNNIPSPILFYNYFSITPQLLEYNDLQKKIEVLPSNDPSITICYEKINNKISKAVSCIRQDLGAYAILLSDVVDCFDPSCDVTQKIIDKLNIEYLESLPENKIQKYFEIIKNKRRG